MKRQISILFVLCMLLAFCAACTPNVDDGPSGVLPTAGGSDPENPGGPDDPGDPNIPGNTGFVFDESRIKGRTITLFHQSESTRTRQYMEEFSELYGCDVDLVVAPWPQDAAKLIALIMAGDSPDVVDLNDEYLPIYAIRKIVEPIDGFFDPESPHLDRAVMDGMKYKGRTYILHPNNRAPVMIFYNKSMFARYGEDTPMDYYDRGEWTIDKLYKVARIFNEDTTGDGVNDQFGFVGTSVYEFLGANQLPLTEYDPATSAFRLALGDQKQQEILQDALDHINAGDIQPFGWTAANLFPAGNLAMAGYEEWLSASLGKMEDEWSVAPYPAGKYGDANMKYIRPWGAGVAAGAPNGYAGMQFVLYTYMRDEELRNETIAPWTGERFADREKAVDKTSYFSLHIGIPNFRSVVDAINYGMAETGGKPFSALFEERRTELESIIRDFNAIEEGWVEPKQFTYLGPVGFEDGMGYLTLPPDETVSQEIVDNGIDGKSLKITLNDDGAYPIFGATADSLALPGGQREYHVSFDYEIIRADDNADLKPRLNVMVNPGEMGWDEISVKQGDKGRAELVVRLYEDKPDLYLVVCFRGGSELLIDNFDITLAE